MLNDDINQLERFLNHVFQRNRPAHHFSPLRRLGALCGFLNPGIGYGADPFIVIGSLYYQKKIAPYYQSIRKGRPVGNRLENNISAYWSSKLYAEQFEAKRVEETSEQYQDANFNAINWSRSTSPLSAFYQYRICADPAHWSLWVLFIR